MPTATSHAEHSQLIESRGLHGRMPRPITVTMFGAGSFFTGAILRDVVLIPNHEGGELRLIDIDPDRLELSRKMMERILSEAPNGERWRLRASTDRRELLPGTDYIVNAIEV